MMCSRGHRYTPTSRHARCPVCESARNQQRMRSPRHRVYSTKRWQKTRAIIRDRYDNECAYQDATCSGGLEVHHIIPTRYDSTRFFDLDKPRARLPGSSRDAR
jgi:5-methylcytosine-specific restriction endonuclease McrA